MARTEDIAVNLRRSHSLFYNKALPEFDFGAIQCNKLIIKKYCKNTYYKLKGKIIKTLKLKKIKNDTLKMKKIFN